MLVADPIPRLIGEAQAPHRLPVFSLRSTVQTSLKVSSFVASHRSTAGWYPADLNFIERFMLRKQRFQAAPLQEPCGVLIRL